MEINFGDYHFVTKWYLIMAYDVLKWTLSMFKRNIEVELKKWKNDSTRKPLILRGARQVGKTSVIRKFAKENFENLFEINLENKETYRKFENVVSVSDFITRLEVIENRKFTSSNSLLFIDEIQESSDVMNLLRFFAEDRPDIYLITTGSLLEAKLNSDFRIPVGRIEYKFLYPLTFFEYLEATSNQILKKEIESMKLGDTNSLNDMASAEYKNYVYVGGMPAVVAKYVEKQNFFEIKEILSRLYSTYIDDVSKYSKKHGEKKYLEWVVEMGPKYGGCLFRYEKFADSEYRSREMSDAFRVIEKIMILNQVSSVNSTNLPLNFKLKRPKKLIWLDVGIVNYFNNAYPEMIQGIYAGRIMEQIVGQTLITRFNQRRFELGYWSKDKDEGSAEVDFCFQYKDKIVGLEVKSGIGVKSRSLGNMVKEGKGKVIPVQVSWDKLEIGKNGVLSLPFYLLERIDEFLNFYNL